MTQFRDLHKLNVHEHNDDVEYSREDFKAVKDEVQAAVTVIEIKE